MTECSRILRVIFYCVAADPGEIGQKHILRILQLAATTKNFKYKTTDSMVTHCVRGGQMDLCCGKIDRMS